MRPVIEAARESGSAMIGCNRQGEGGGMVG